MIPRLLTPILFESTDFNVGPVYHGGTWDGKSPMRVNGRGALGIGAYFTPIRSKAEGYAKESGGTVVETYLRCPNPLEIHVNHGSEHPCVQALVKLGMNEAKAEKLVERVEEKYGYMGGEIKKLALEQGYTGLFEYFNGTLTEIVVWTPQQVQTEQS
jgi:hypothetical protein